jgi:hypothetical protein
MSETPGEKPQHQSRMPRSKRWQDYGKLTYGLIGLVASLITIGLLVWQLSPRPGPITFTSPSPDQTTQVPCNFTVTGKGSPPAGQQLLLSVQEQEQGNSNISSTMHFVVPTTGPDTWQMDDVVVGSDNTPTGTPFKLTIWRANADWINYLTQVTDHQPAWWNAPGDPPGAMEAQSVTVTREAGKCSP